MVRLLIEGIVVTYFLVQITKVLYFTGKTGKLYWKAVFLPGGMPSVHTAFVASLFVGLLITEGWSALTVAVFVFGSIVAYDALSLRREVSFQKDLLERLHLKVEKKEAKTFLAKEHIGHTPSQVIVGTLLGILGPLVVYAVRVFW